MAIWGKSIKRKQTNKQKPANNNKKPHQTNQRDGDK